MENDIDALRKFGQQPEIQNIIDNHFDPVLRLDQGCRAPARGRRPSTKCVNQMGANEPGATGN
jgi:hypothetical protein